jgi:aminopeptidase N
MRKAGLGVAYAAASYMRRRKILLRDPRIITASIYRDQNALTEDLQRVMESHYGQPLGWFFKQWIYEPGYPQLDASLGVWSESSKELTLRIEERTITGVYTGCRLMSNSKSTRTAAAKTI